MSNLSESGHFYDLQGNPAYTIVGKNGKERNTNVRDARELKLVPSVTTILSLLAKPGLDAWKAEQVLLAALTLPRGVLETEADWIDRVKQDSRATGKQAMERGTQMHHVLEQYYLKEDITYPAFAQRTALMIDEYFGVTNWDSERSFAHKLGFGGKCDLSHPDGFVLDFKTKESLDKAAIYDEHILQLAAYRVGLGLPTAKCAIVFVSEKETQIHEIVEEKLASGYEQFELLVKFYKKKNRI